MNIYLIIYLLFCHWLADFVLQSHHQATNKSKSNKVLAFHCYIYGGTLGIMTLNPLFGLFNGLIHFPVDYVTSRVNARLWEKKDIHNFFVSIGFDQLIHFVTIILLWNYLNK